MDFEVRRMSRQYKKLKIIDLDDHTEIDTGFINKDEQKGIALQLIYAAQELLED